MIVQTPWYDNEWGYSCRCVDLAILIGNKPCQANPQPKKSEQELHKKMMGNDETKKFITSLVEKIKTAYHPEKIILFGSYAYGTPMQDSDLDLLIIKRTHERPIDRRTTVRRAISSPKRQIPLELIVLTPEEIQSRMDVGDQFVEEIILKGEVLYAA